ncbi:MAG: hypothetical protein AB7U83_20405 [Vicinamibacterales bacterium]
MSALTSHASPGCAAILYTTTGRRVWYRCDPSTHHVVVSDESGQTLRVFGGWGRGPGRLDTPLDLAFVQPAFAGERLPAGHADAIWVAVADYGNRRVQVFELDGAVVGEVVLDGRGGEPWPPTALTWRAPVLEVEGVEGSRTGIHLSGALLAGTAARRERQPPVHSGVEARH